MKAIYQNLFLLSMLLLTSFTCQGQTFEEWFRQKETKKEYLVQQIAALQAYAGTLRHGYEIVSHGINSVQQIKNGDLGLHQAFFGSLRKINSAIGNAPLIADILSCQAAILRYFGQALQAQQRENLLRTTELAYLKQVKETVLQACLEDLETLWLLLSSDIEMKDEERLRQIEALHASMLDKYRFTQTFLQEAQTLALQRTREKQEIEASKALFGLP